MRVGILGGGQLGRMLALAGYPLDIRCRVFDPAPDACAGQVAEHFKGDFDDYAAVERFVAGLDAVTYEWENVPVGAVRHAGGFVPVHPGAEALETAQDRFLEKSLFRKLGIATAPFAATDSRDDFEAAILVIGLPAVLKTRRLGYDGKGQRVIRTAAEADAAWSALGGVPLLLEGFIPFERELSIIAVRSPGRGNGAADRAAYPVVENVHSAGILRVSRGPAPGLTPDLQEAAEEIAARLLDAFNYAGVLAVELFEHEGRLLANEIAPRVHNSGHWTIEGAETSQFENHLRAVCGLPLGSPAARGYSAMVNLIGSAPALDRLSAVPGAHVHLYGKEARPGRKIGHVTVRGDSRGAIETSLSLIEELIDAERV